MIELVGKDYEDEKYDSCGNTTHAVLKINHIKIPLCEECLKELLESVEKFNNIIFCHQCEYFVKNELDWDSGGTCKKKREKVNKFILPSNVWYGYHVECMDTCEEAVRKEE